MNSRLVRWGALAAGVFPKARMHTPVEVSEEATAYAREIGADGVLLRHKAGGCGPGAGCSPTEALLHPVQDLITVSHCLPWEVGTSERNDG